MSQLSLNYFTEVHHVGRGRCEVEVYRRGKSAGSFIAGGEGHLVSQTCQCTFAKAGEEDTNFAPTLLKSSLLVLRSHGLTHAVARRGKTGVVGVQGGD